MKMGINAGLGGCTSPSSTPAFTPAAIPGILAWWRADAANITLNGATVSAWADKSGASDANRNATQGTAANQPTYIASDANFNGQPSVDFGTAPSNHRLVTGVFSIGPSNPYTVCLVARAKHVAGGSSEYFFDSISGAQAGLFENNSAGWAMVGGATLAGGSGPADTALHAYICEFNGGSSKLKIDNTTTAVLTGNTGASAPTGFTLGDTQGGGTFSDTVCAEMFVSSGLYSAGTASSLRAYILNRYALTVAP